MFHQTSRAPVVTVWTPGASPPRYPNSASLHCNLFSTGFTPRGTEGRKEGEYRLLPKPPEGTVLMGCSPYGRVTRLCPEHLTQSDEICFSHQMGAGAARVTARQRLLMLTRGLPRPGDGPSRGRPVGLGPGEGNVGRAPSACAGGVDSVRGPLCV